jgi:hypothetical protein
MGRNTSGAQLQLRPRVDRLPIGWSLLAILVLSALSWALVIEVVKVLL